jgi:hypothetical protein
MRIKRKQSRVSNQHDRARHEETARCTWACRRLCVAQSCGKTRHCRTIGVSGGARHSSVVWRLRRPSSRGPQGSLPAHVVTRVSPMEIACTLKRSLKRIGWYRAGGT